MLLTEQEVDALRKSLPAVCKHQDVIRAAESAVLEKLKMQEPDAWRTFDGEGGYDYRSYVDNEKYQAEFLARNPSSTYKNWVEPLYTNPLPPDDVVRDAERYRFLRDETYLVNPIVAVVWKRNDDRDESEWVNTVDGYTLDCHIDAAMKEMK